MPEVYVKVLSGHETGAFRDGIAKYGGEFLDLDAAAERGALGLSKLTITDDDWKPMVQFKVGPATVSLARAVLEAALTATDSTGGSDG